MRDFSIIIATHGEDKWEKLALERAFPSAESQGVPVYIGHDSTSDRATVRNRLAEKTDSDVLIFLDGDDELGEGYVAAMQETAEDQKGVWPYLLTPKVSYVDKRGKAETARFWPEVPIRHGNWMVVGTAVPRDLFFEVGGWRSLTSTGRLNEYDDWDLWIRCQLKGATPVRALDAIYIAHVRSDSVHRTVSLKQKLAWTAEIQELNWPEAVPR
jgi:hypothetical protein